MRPSVQRQNTDQILEYYYEEEAGPRLVRSTAPPDNRHLHIVELDPDLNRRFNASRLALVAPPDDQATTPDVGEGRQIGAKVAPPTMVRLGSSDTWLPPSPTKPRGAPPPRPPRLSSPPPKGSPATSFRSLASLAPAPITRGNSDYSIIAVSDSSERSTPNEEPSSSTSSHRREGAFPPHSVFQSPSKSHSGDGLPEPSTDDRAYHHPLGAVGESETESEDEPGTGRRRSGTITSRSTRTHTTTPSTASNYTPSSHSHYTQSSKSNYSRTAHDASDDMQDLIATVGSALSDMGLNPADLPPATVIPPPDDDKPSRRPSVDNLRGSLDAKRTTRSPGPSQTGSPRASSSISPAEFTMRGSPRTSLSELARGSPRTSLSEFSRGSPRPSMQELVRGSPRPSMSDLARGSPRPSMSDLARASPKTSMSDLARPSMSDLARGSPKPSIAEFPRTEYSRGSPRPTSVIESRSSLSRTGSPEKRRLRDLSPEKPRLSDALRARDASPEKGQSRHEPERGQSRHGHGESERGQSRHGHGEPEKGRVGEVLHETGRSGSPQSVSVRAVSPRTSGSPHNTRFSPDITRSLDNARFSPDNARSLDNTHARSPDNAHARSPDNAHARSSPDNTRFSPDARSGRSRSPEKARTVPTITRSSYEQPPSALSSPRSVNTHVGSSHTHTQTGSHPSPQTASGSHPSPRTTSGSHPSPRTTSRSSHPSPQSPTSPPRRPTIHQNNSTTEHLRFRQPGAPLPESFYFADVLRMKSSAERAQGYVRKINQLAAEESGLGYWVGFMKGRVRPGPDGQPTPTGPLSPSALLTTFGPQGPGTRRQQPRHVSGGSTTSEATFAVRPDAYVATNISLRSESPPLGPPPALPYPSLAKDIGIRAVDSRTTSSASGAMKAKVGSVGFFSTIGRKASVRRERDRTVMQQARKPHVLRTGTGNGAAGGYAELPTAVKQVQLSAPPTIPGGPRAKPGSVRREGGPGSDIGHGGGGSTRSSVIMIGGRDSFQTMSPSGDGRPVSIRVPSSNGHGVVTPNLPPLSPGLRSPEPPSSFKGVDSGSVYSGYSGYSRERDRDRDSTYGGGGGSQVGHGSMKTGGGLDQLADVLPHVDRTILAGYLDRANGHEIDAISAYLEDERRMNAVMTGKAASSVGHGYG